jgi:hypothetical protein
MSSAHAEKMEVLAALKPKRENDAGGSKTLLFSWRE